MGETQGQGSETCMAVAAPPGPPRKRRRRKRKHTGDTDTSPLQAGRTAGPPWSPAHRKEGQAEPSVGRPEEEGGQQPGNGWPVGCGSDGHRVSRRKRRRKGAEGLGGEDCLRQDPPQHG